MSDDSAEREGPYALLQRGEALELDPSAHPWCIAGHSRGSVPEKPLLDEA